jgi:hypothetical protein
MPASYFIIKVTVCQRYIIYISCIHDVCVCENNVHNYLLIFIVFCFFQLM